jgi:hypothetical protein
LTDVVGTAGGGGNGAVNEGVVAKGADELLAFGVACRERGPAIVVTGEGILVASEEGCGGHEEGGAIRLGIFAGY